METSAVDQSVHEMNSPSPGGDPTELGNSALRARLEPFDSYWQAPEDVEAGYGTFYAYYKANYLPHMPENRQASILVVSCGPGYLVNTLIKHGYTNVTGIDSDTEKIAHATSHGLNCEAAEAFPFLSNNTNAYDVILPEQELNHLALEEQIQFLCLCKASLKPTGYVFNTFTEYSLAQVLEVAGFTKITTMPLKLYVFWKNPLNYVGLAITTIYETYCRIMFKLYGKNVRILSKKVAAVAFRNI